MKWLVLVLGILSNASASVLVKIAMQPPRRFFSFEDPLAVLDNGPFWLGLFCYGLAFLLYAKALAVLPLNVAHPLLTAGAIMMVALFSILFFHEPFYWTRALGFLFVIAGVVLISLRTA